MKTKQNKKKKNKKDSFELFAKHRKSVKEVNIHRFIHITHIHMLPIGECFIELANNYRSWKNVASKDRFSIEFVWLLTKEMKIKLRTTGQ